MRRSFRTFIGVDLGGGKGKTTAVVRLRLELEAGDREPLRPSERESLRNGDRLQVPQLTVEDAGIGRTFYDDRLLEYLLRHADDAVLAMDAPLTLPACVRCTLPRCPGLAACDVPTVRWFSTRSEAKSDKNGKPRYTPYTQRATEVVLHEDHGIVPRETLGQGMGPLTARMAYLKHALAGSYDLNRNLLEVYPKATLAQLFPDPEPPPPPRGISYLDGNGRPVGLDGKLARGMRSEIAQKYKRSGHGPQIRSRVLGELPELRFGPGQWRESLIQSDHAFDALLCAYTAYLWARDGWSLPGEPVFAEDGWIWIPPRRGRA
ncbi:MAG: DUF429 domain-containing protein [Polyangia bacterium]